MLPLAFFCAKSSGIALQYLEFQYYRCDDPSRLAGRGGGGGGGGGGRGASGGYKSAALLQQLAVLRCRARGTHVLVAVIEREDNNVKKKLVMYRWPSPSANT